jgi:putative endonuclease
MARSHSVGRQGEAAVATYLQRSGWRILARNWRFYHKELDIVAERDGVIAFVEVKTRATGGWGSPLEAITPAKRRELTLAARGWIAAHGRRDRAYRFDAAIIVNGSRHTTLEYVEDAWRL